MASSPKKVIVRSLDQTTQAGYLELSRFVRPTPAGPGLEILLLNGKTLPLALAEVQWIAYVRDFNLSDSVDPERLERRMFLARPRAEGLWLRLALVNGVSLEGLAPIDLALADDLVEDHGLFLLPPDLRSNTQRLFVPRSACTRLQLLAVITTPSKGALTPKQPAGPSGQDSLFPDLKR